jgi:hypothetical protein
MLQAGGSAVRLAASGFAGPLRHPHQAAEALSRARALAEVLVKDELVAAPRSSLNDPIGTHRGLAVMTVPLGELKEIKQSLGGSVNDVVLAATAGGLRELLRSRGETLPAQGLRAMVPVNIRSATERLALATGSPHCSSISPSPRPTRSTATGGRSRRRRGSRPALRRPARSRS